MDNERILVCAGSKIKEYKLEKTGKKIEFERESVLNLKAGATILKPKGNLYPVSQHNFVGLTNPDLVFRLQETSNIIFDYMPIDNNRIAAISATPQS